MNCFYHLDKDAVGVCKSCGRGLCAQCAVDVGRGLACRESCEQDARALVEFEDHQIKAAASDKGLLGSTGRDALYFLAYIAIGGVFVWSRSSFLYDFRYPAIVPRLILIIGICLIAFGVLNIARAVAMWIRLRKASRAGAS